MDIIRSTLSSDKKSSIIFTSIFLYTLGTGLLIQIVILPYLFPAWHWGDGLLSGLDSVRFHKLAIILAERIKTQRWDAWVLRPERQAPAGITSIFYTFFPAHPYVLLPLNAFLHAVSGLTLFKIIKKIVFDEQLAIIAILPFTFFPSSLTWTSQIHKDGLFIAGIYLYLYAWLILINLNEPKSSKMRGMVLSVLGLFFVWIVREYAVKMLAATSILLFALYIFQMYRKKNEQKAFPFGSAFAMIGIIALGFSLSNIKIKNDFKRYPSIATLEEASQIIDEEVLPMRSKFTWEPSILPNFIDIQLRSFAKKREGYRLGYPNAGSNIDVEISLNSVSEIILYIPRATQIGLLAPFPDEWFGEGSRPVNTLQRRISALEMSFAYIALFFLPFAINLSYG